MNCIQHAKDLLDGKLNIDKALAADNDEECLFEIAIEDPPHENGEEYIF